MTAFSNASPNARGVPRWLIQATKTVCSGGLLWLLFSRVDLGRTWEVARHSSPSWLLVALAFYLIAVVASAWRWHRLLAIQDVAIPFPLVAESLMVALFFNNFLPTNIGGDVMRVRDTARAAGSGTRAMTVVVADRLVGLIALVLCAAVGGAVSVGNQLPFSVMWIWLALVGGLGATAAVLRIPSVAEWPHRRLAALGGTWIGRQLEAFTGSLSNFRSAPIGLLGALVASVLIQTALVLLYAAIANALGVHVGFFEMAVVVPLAGLIQVVPVSINGLGLREATFTVLLGRVGVPAESALLISLEATALITAFSLLGAGMYMLRPQTARQNASPAAARVV